MPVLRERDNGVLVFFFSFGKRARCSANSHIGNGRSLYNLVITEPALKPSQKKNGTPKRIHIGKD
jgi:hypothetical protein